MESAVCPPRGLPFVPLAQPGELFGAWMLRVADAYGVRMKALFAHLGVPPLERRHHPHWSMLHAGSVSWSPLALALHRSESALRAMAAPRYQSDWPLELGGCAHCLAQARAADSALTWQQDWMHVSTPVCEQHRSWLTPVTLRELRDVRDAQGLSELGERVAERESTPFADRGGLLIDGAVWLQRFLQTPEAFDPPWGPVPTAVREQMVDLVSRLMVPKQRSEFAAARVKSVAGGSWRNKDDDEELQCFCHTDHRGSTQRFTSRRQLGARQISMGLIGDFLRHAPTARPKGCDPPLRMILDRRIYFFQRWPLPAIAWISPRAAEFVRGSRELRERHNITPAYFRAHAAMLQEFLDRD